MPARYIHRTFWILLKLWEQEVHDVKENISYGANTIRDGVNLNSFEKRHLLVLPTEISLLPNLIWYLKYPGNWPIAKLSMKLEKPESIAPAFMVQEVKTEIKYGESPLIPFLESIQHDQEEIKLENFLNPSQKTSKRKINREL